MLKLKKTFSIPQADKLIKKYGLKDVLLILSIAARTANKDGDNPGYELVAKKLNELTNLLRK